MKPVNILRKFTIDEKRLFYEAIRQTEQGLYLIDREKKDEYINVTITEDIAIVTFKGNPIKYEYSFKNLFEKFYLINMDGNILPQLKGYFKEIGVLVDVDNNVHITRNTDERVLAYDRQNINTIKL